MRISRRTFLQIFIVSLTMVLCTYLGWKSGYDSGISSGYTSGYSDGQENPTYPVKSKFYNDGYSTGYDDGYTEGVKSRSGFPFQANDTDRDLSIQERLDKMKERSDSTQMLTVVYVTKNGEKYHQYGCKYLPKTCIPMSLSEAKSEGYSPCSICW